MTNEAMNPAERMAAFRRRVNFKLNRYEGIAKAKTEALMADFNNRFDCYAEEIFKANLLREYSKELADLLSEETITIEKAIETLQHAKEHTGDDIMFGDPYRNSSNGAANLAHRWAYEVKRTIYNSTCNFLTDLTE